MISSVPNFTAIVAGATGGIGQATCQYLTEHGVTVIAASRRTEWTTVNAAIHVSADLSSAQGWHDVVSCSLARYDRIDVLVNCVGSLTPASFEHLSETDINRMLTSNIAAIAYGVQAVVPIMRRQGHGHIINIGSLGGIIPMPFEALYSAVKFAVRGLTLSLRKELENTGIAVSLLSPGAVRTPMLDREALDDQSSLTFATKVLEPEDIAREIFNLILKPKNEVILPKKVAVLARLAGAYPGLLSALYPFLRIAGRARLASYRKIRLLTPAQITGAVQ